MKLSIIMPVYNAEKTIRMAINSVVGILNDSVELIIVDDGSTDTTSEICRAYKEKFLSIRTIKLVNGGVSNARNVGIDNACGEYIMFIDADDENLLNRKDLEILDKNPEFVLFSYVMKVLTGKEKSYATNNTQILASELPGFVANNYALCSSPWAKIYKRELILQSGLKFLKDQKYGEDTTFVFSYLASIKNEIIVRETVAYRYYIYANSASGFRSYYKVMNLYLYNILNAYLKFNAESIHTGNIANYLFDKAIMHYYINNNLREFENRFIETHDYFKDYLNIETINRESLNYIFPVSKESIRKIYLINIGYKIKKIIKSVIWK